MEVTKWLKPSISVSRIGDSASVQAATRVNAEQSSKRTMRRSTRQPYRGRLIPERSDTFRRCAGVVAAACARTVGRGQGFCSGHCRMTCSGSSCAGPDKEDKVAA